VRVVIQWNRLPSKFLASPYMETFKIQLNMTLSNLLKLTLLEEGGWTR